MNTNINKHLQGIYTSFMARINLINASIGHNATQGAETENDIRNLLLEFLPSNFGVGSGKIVDIEGVPSRQVDIIIFDKSKPNYTMSNDSKIFLADHVIAAIEIKTTFTLKSLKEALKNIASVKKMKVANRPWTEATTDTNGQWTIKNYNQPMPPLGMIFFFKAQETQRRLI